MQTIFTEKNKLLWTIGQLLFSQLCARASRASSRQTSLHHFRGSQSAVFGKRMEGFPFFLVFSFFTIDVSLLSYAPSGLFSFSKRQLVQGVPTWQQISIVL